MDDKLQKTGTQALATSEEFGDLVADAGTGRENIDANDIRPPRMKICQSGSPERKPDNPKQIKGLEELDLFNTLSSEKYGRSVNFVVVAFLGITYVEFDKELQVVERDIPASDPRTKFTLAEDGKTSVKPIATAFYNFLLFLTDKQEPVLFSFKGTGIGVAKTLINKMNYRLVIEGQLIMQPPIWARMFNLKTEMKEDGGFSWGIFNVSQLEGLTPTALRKQISGYAKSIAGKKIVMDVDEAPAEPGTAPEGGNNTGGEGDPTDM